MFPAITDALRSAYKAVRSGMGEETLALNINEQKAGGGISFDAVNAGWYARNGYPGIYTLLSGGMPAWSGEPVSLSTALNHSVVWACNRLISETQGATPLAMLQQSKNGAKELAVGHPMFSALRNAVNDEMSAMSFKETRTSQTLLDGNGFAQIIRRSGTGVAVELRALDAAQVRVDREKGGQRRLVYIVKHEANSSATNNETTFTLTPGQPQDILHIRGIGWDGLRGYSVITMARQSIGTAISAERNVARFYANGGRVPYLLNMEKKFSTDEQFDKFRADWETIYAEPHKVPLLEPGMKYQAIGLNAVDSQMIETRLFDIHEICRWFLVSPHLVGDLSRATFSNIEQLALEFIKVTMQSWFTRWEQDLWRCVLTPEEKGQGYYFKHNTNELLRGDFLTRMQGYSIMLQNGIASDNEVRDLEDWNPFKGGDGHHIQLNMQPVPGTPGAAQPVAQSPNLVRISE
jgi:HK97 family phage portal protein